MSNPIVLCFLCLNGNLKLLLLVRSKNLEKCTSIIHWSNANHVVPISILVVLQWCVLMFSLYSGSPCICMSFWCYHFICMWNHGIHQQLLWYAHKVECVAKESPVLLVEFLFVDQRKIVLSIHKNLTECTCTSCSSAYLFWNLGQSAWDITRQSAWTITRYGAKSRITTIHTFLVLHNTDCFKLVCVPICLIRILST